MPQPAPSITVKIENSRPVELVDFTRSLLALGDEFRREVAARSDGVDGKLYVKELRNGSLVAELMVIAPVAGAVMEAANLTSDFFGNLKSAIEWLKAQGPMPEKMDSKRAANISAILEPVAKDNGSVCNVSLNIEGDVNASITINAGEANAAQNRAERYLADQKEPHTKVHEKVLMYWAVVKNEAGLPGAGEKAMIDKLCDRPLKVVFDSRELREEMLRGHENPLREAYVVDIEAQTARGRIACYKVLQLHERIPLDDGTLKP